MQAPSPWSSRLQGNAPAPVRQTPSILSAAYVKLKENPNWGAGCEMVDCWFVRSQRKVMLTLRLLRRKYVSAGWPWKLSQESQLFSRPVTRKCSTISFPESSLCPPQTVFRVSFSRDGVRESTSATELWRFPREVSRIGVPRYFIVGGGEYASRFGDKNNVDNGLI